jgi:folate-binding Fe-S cluster repair protein YgfZ
VAYSQRPLSLASVTGLENNPKVPSMANMLSSGKAFADLSSWRKVDVSGTEALSWLEQLVSVRVTDLAPGQGLVAVMRSNQSVLAKITIAVAGGNVLLIQEPSQSCFIMDLLSARVEGSDVVLDDRTEDLALFAFPGRAVAPNAPGTAFYAPSCLGVGIDLISLMADRRFVLSSLEKAFTLAGPEDLETWRVASAGDKGGV